MRFWLGGYGPDMEGAGTGVGVLRAGAADERLASGPLALVGDAAAAASPSWLAPHPTLDVIYAALEGAGAVQVFVRTGEESFAPLGAAVPVGEALCHLAVAPDGGSLVACCYGDGRVALLPLDATGRPGAPVPAAASVDPYAGSDLTFALAEAALIVDPEAPAVDMSAERPSRAHEAANLPGGVVATTDLGHDVVRFWRRGAAGLTALGRVALPKGAGPRHMVWHPSGHLHVVTEYSGEIFTLAPDAAGAWRLIGGISLGALPGDYPAELAASRDGEFLYAGVRGSNTIATVRVRGAGDTLEPVALVESGVDWPRHHVIANDTLLVVGQRSDDVASLSLDIRTGVPGKVRHRTAAPAPTCLLPARA